MTRSELVNFLVKKTNLTLIEAICFSMDIPYDEIPGMKLSIKVINLLKYCENHGRLSDLEQEFKGIDVEVSLDILKTGAQKSAFSGHEYRQTWSCDMQELSKAVRKTVIGKTGLVGCAVSCPPTTIRYGLDVFLENLCRQSRANLGWDNICYVEGPGKLDPLLGVDLTMRMIKPHMAKLRQGKHVFFHLRWDDTSPTNVGLTDFWAKLQETFTAEMGQSLKDLKHVFVIMMGSSPGDMPFPPEANITYLGALSLDREDLSDWMYEVLTVKSNRWRDANWHNSVPDKWADLIAKYSQIGDELNVGSVNLNLKTSLEILDTCDSGASFLEQLEERFK